MGEDSARTVLPGFVKERRCCAWLAFPVVQAPDDLVSPVWRASGATFSMGQ